MWLTAALALVAVPLALPLAPAAAQAPEPAAADEARSDLRVLFVGHDPSDPQILFPDAANARTAELHRERTAAFEALLREHFEHVTVVHGPRYRVEMSDAVDVTVFDALPAPLPSPSEAGDDAGTRAYLPRSFDRPALMIGATSGRIGGSLGLKLDWL